MKCITYVNLIKTPLSCRKLRIIEDLVADIIAHIEAMMYDDTLLNL